MGALSAQLARAAVTPRGNICRTCHWLATTDAIDDEDRANINAWIDQGLPSITLWRMLKALGLPASSDSFRKRHYSERHHERV